MFHGSVVPQFEAEGVACSQLSHLCLSCIGEESAVASKVVARGEELLGGHDAVAVFADVLEVG